MGQELKACPFCGSSKVTVDNVMANGDTWGVTCHTDGCHGNIYRPNCEYATKAYAVEAWNRRPPTEQGQGGAWISVEDRPEDHGEVWVCDRWGDMCLGCWNDGDKMWWKDAPGGRTPIVSPMYWQPKPALPDCDVIRAHIAAMRSSAAHPQPSADTGRDAMEELAYEIVELTESSRIAIGAGFRGYEDAWRKLVYDIRQTTKAALSPPEKDAPEEAE